MIGVIGTGCWGENIIETLKRMKIDLKVCNNHGSYQGQDCYSNWFKLIQSRPDGVIVAANPAINASVVKQCDLFGVPCLLEKPAAFFLKDVLQMATSKTPIMVDYIHLFNPKYKTMKSLLRSPITRIESTGTNYGPFRHFSSLYDYAPHDLSMCMDLLPEEFKLKYYGYSTHPKSRGKIFNLTFKSGDAEVKIHCGNGGDEKERRLVVECENGDILKYTDETACTAPLNMVIKQFLGVINGKEEPNPSFDLTVRIHQTLNKLGVDKWASQK